VFARELLLQPDESLTFARDAHGDEAYVRLDLESLLESVIDGENDVVGGSVEFHGPVRLIVEAQTVVLRRALTNLVQNAVQYGGRARVAMSQEGDEVAVRIEDQGPGIAPEDRVRVLKPYVRLEGSRSRDTGGTGLGLAIASNVIRRLEGSIAFGGGAGQFAVVVRLPAVRSGRTER
jgi:signal transduction histidine kinase|tara:strand:- start:993 stop:1523 length:531 start_codon:yes stop_codon:yes gene_type:complete